MSKRNNNLKVALGTRWSGLQNFRYVQRINMMLQRNRKDLNFKGSIFLQKHRHSFWRVSKARGVGISTKNVVNDAMGLENRVCHKINHGVDHGTGTMIYNNPIITVEQFC